jgi:hypothetical protein
MRDFKVTLISLIERCGPWDVFELESYVLELFGLTDATSKAAFCPSRLGAARDRMQTMQ